MRPRLLAEALELYRLPRVAIELSGDEGCHLWFRTFTRRHRRWRLIQNKAWGVALLAIPLHYEEFVADPRRAHLRKQVRRARRAGYTYGPVDPIERLDEIMDVHRSAAERQGRPMHPDYLDEATVAHFFESVPEVVGVFDRAGRLCAYFGFRPCGRAVCGERVLGHSDHMDAGIMYLLFAELTRELAARRTTTGVPEWLVYDMFPGASPGMRRYKRWLGFEPYRVSWTWRSEHARPVHTRLPGA